MNRNQPRGIARPTAEYYADWNPGGGAVASMPTGHAEGDVDNPLPLSLPPTPPNTLPSPHHHHQHSTSTPTSSTSTPPPTATRPTRNPYKNRRWTKQEGFLINQLHDLGFRGARQAVASYGPKLVSAALKDLQEELQAGRVDDPARFLSWLLKQYQYDTDWSDGEGTNG